MYLKFVLGAKQGCMVPKTPYPGTWNHRRGDGGGSGGGGGGGVASCSEEVNPKSSLLSITVRIRVTNCACKSSNGMWKGRVVSLSTLSGVVVECTHGSRSKIPAAHDVLWKQFRRHIPACACTPGLRAGGETRLGLGVGGLGDGPLVQLCEGDGLVVPEVLHVGVRRRPRGRAGKAGRQFVYRLK